MSEATGRHVMRAEAVDAEADVERRALAIWPRLRPSDLRRCHRDPERVAALVSRRTSLPYDSIVRLLTAQPPVGTIRRPGH